MEENKMKQAVLRIYMTVSAKAPGDPSIWRELFGGSLAHFLAKQANEFGIEQAGVQRVSAGYLKGHKLVVAMPETITLDLPQCVELIDTEEKLNAFLAANREALRDCKVVLLEVLSPAIELNEP
jgi:PII-like signaling protein